LFFPYSYVYRGKLFSVASPPPRRKTDLQRDGEGRIFRHDGKRFTYRPAQNAVHFA